MAVPRPGNKRMANRPANGNNMRRFKPGNQQPRRMNMGGIGAMFNTNQIPSNGYLDFTEPTNMTTNTNANNSQKQFKNNNSNNAGTNGNANSSNNGKNRNGQRRNNNGQRAQGGMNNNNMNGGGNNPRWGNRGRSLANNNRNNNNMNNGMRQGNMMPFNGPPRMHPMGPMPPLPPMGMLPPLPPPMTIMNGRFPPRPLMPPIPMVGPIRRPPNFRMGPRIGPGPFPNRGMMPRNNGGGGPIRRNKVAGGIVNKNNRRNGGGSGPTNQKNRKKNQVKNGKRTNQNVNKYALDKPWVNDEIKEAHQMKTDLENQLKGKKNDEIFAKFKEQRDKFVSLYDAAKQAHLTAQKEVNILRFCCFTISFSSAVTSKFHRLKKFLCLNVLALK